MPNIAVVLKAERARIARRETKVDSPALLGAVFLDQHHLDAKPQDQYPRLTNVAVGLRGFGSWALALSGVQGSF